MPTDDRVSFTLKAGETARVVLFAGEKARAQWQPKATFMGKDVDSFEAQCRLAGTRSSYGTYRYGEEGACASRLPPRQYSVQLLDLPELNFTLAPGETRHDTFEIPVRNVLIRADAALCALLDPGEYGVAFSLSASPNWAMLSHAGLSALPGQICLFEFAQTLQVPDETSESNHAWSFAIPPGVYEWRLSAGTHNIVGLLDLRGRGDTSIVLSLHNLPSLGVLEIPCPGYAEGEHPDVDFSAVLPDFGNTLASDLNQECYAMASRAFFDDERGTWLVIAPVGRALLTISESEMTYYRQVSVPGTLLLSPQPCAQLRIHNEDSRYTLGGVATCNGMIVPIDAMTTSYDSITYLPRGNWLLNLRGEREDEEGERESVFADTWVYLGSEEQEIAAAHLPWRLCGEATLTLGSGEAWCVFEQNGKLNAQSLDLAALGVALRLGAGDFVQTDNCYAWTFKGLPEGRYRVSLPRRGGSRDIEFFVEAGQKIRLAP